jgi:hypothetical protein
MSLGRHTMTEGAMGHFPASGWSYHVGGWPAFIQDQKRPDYEGLLHAAAYSRRLQGNRQSFRLRENTETEYYQDQAIVALVKWWALHPLGSYGSRHAAKQLTVALNLVRFSTWIAESVSCILLCKRMLTYMYAHVMSAWV